MKLNIRWKSLLQEFDTISSIETYDKDRNDILNLLNVIDKNGADINVIANLFGGSEIHKVIAKRVLRYLEDSNYIFNGVLTNEGKNILRTRLVPVKEKGKFKFLAIDSIGPMKDMYGSGDKLIVDYKREKDSRVRSREKDSNENYKSDIVINSLEKERFRILKLGENQGKNPDFSCTKYNSQNNNAHLNLNLDCDKNKIKFIFSGKSLINKNMNNHILFDEEAKFKLDDYVIDILGKNIEYLSWDNSNTMFRVKNIEELLKFKVISSKDLIDFRTNIDLKDIEIEGNKCSLEANDIPIMPDNISEAELWVKICVELLAESRYMTDSEFDIEVSNLLDSPGLREYKTYLNVNLEEYIINMKDSNKRVFWNLRAPMDLKPNYTQTGIIDLNIAFGRESSIYDIFKSLVGDNYIDEFVFLSKYINTRNQIKKCNLLLDTFRSFGAEKILVLSNNKKLDLDVEVLQYDDVFGNKKNWPHDRYFAFKSNGRWIYYKMSAELDQCIFNEDIEKWDKDLIGKWKDISFYRINEDIFPSGVIEKFEQYLVEC